jgi:hypothetical protein
LLTDRPPDAHDRYADNNPYYPPYQDPDTQGIPLYLREAEEDTPRWTCRRILFVAITLLVIFAFLTMNYVPGILSAVQEAQNPRPTPTSLPRADVLPSDLSLPYDGYL